MSNTKPIIRIDNLPLRVNFISEYFTGTSEKGTRYRICHSKKSDIMCSPVIVIPETSQTIAPGMPSWFKKDMWVEGTPNINTTTLDAKITRKDGKVVDVRQRVTTVTFPNNVFFTAVSGPAAHAYIYDRENDKYYRWFGSMESFILETDGMGKIDTGKTRCSEVSEEEVFYYKKIEEVD